MSIKDNDLSAEIRNLQNNLDDFVEIIDGMIEDDGPVKQSEVYYNTDFSLEQIVLYTRLAADLGMIEVLNDDGLSRKILRTSQPL